MDVQRAYAAFTVKAIDTGRRSFSGWATTPATDRVGDTINPMGATFSNPIVLLRQHWHDQPVGRVNLKRPTAKGIEFDAEIPLVEEEGSFRDRVDTAWGEIKYGVVRAVSIGFKPVKYAFKEDGGIDFQEVEIYELSTVSVACLPEAVITSVKSMHPALSREAIELIRTADAKNVGSVKLLAPRSRGIQLVTRA